MNLTLTIPESEQPPITVTVGGTTGGATELTSYVSQVAGLPDYPATFPPAIGSAANQAVAGNDPRLTNPRAPSPHTHPLADLTGVTPAAIGAMENTNAAVNAAIAENESLSRLALLNGTAIFNVRDYGAAGNGVADDRAGIQAACTAAKNAGGGIVYLPPGTYALGTKCPPEVSAYKGSVRVYSNTIFMGAGDATIITAKDDLVYDTPLLFAHTYVAGEPGEANYTTTDVCFCNFKMDGNAYRTLFGGTAKVPFGENEGISMRATSRMRFYDILFTNLNGDCLDLDGSQDSEFHWVDRCSFHDTWGVGIHSGGSHFFTTNCSFKNVGYNRLNMYNPALPRETRWITPMAGGSAYWDGCSMDTRTGSNHVIRNCVFRGGAQGIKIGVNTLVDGCSFSGPFLNGTGIMVGAIIEPGATDTPNNVVIRNCGFATMTDPADSDTEEKKIGRGIWVRHGADTVIEGCYFSGAQGAGIVVGKSMAFGSGTQGTARGTVIRNNTFQTAYSDVTYGGNIHLNDGCINPQIYGNKMMGDAGSLVRSYANHSGGIISNNVSRFGFYIADIRYRWDRLRITGNVSFNIAGTPTGSSQRSTIRFFATGSSPNRGIDSESCLITGNDVAQVFTGLSTANNIIKNNIWSGVWTADNF
jgi:hypothetical protein